MADVTAVLQSENPAGLLGAAAGATVYPLSITHEGAALFFLARRDPERLLGVLSGQAGDGYLDLEWREARVGDQAYHLGLGATSHANAVALRRRLPFTAPVALGLARSVGLGDRLGTATPGHIRALRRVGGMAPVLAQQSIREMERTGRTPEDVIDSATWGVFQEGWRGGHGADADHLKIAGDIDICARAGFVLYTLDPRDHVDNDADTEGVSTLASKLEALPWSRLETTAAATLKAYAGRSWVLGAEYRLTLSEDQVLRAACKYGRAIAHLLSMYRHLVAVMGDRPYELEISVDESETPTRPEEHFYIASELKRLGVEWVSLGPRHVGGFEKGVDYVGDAGRFESDFARHVAISRALGPYKLSLHSGSDKFAIYPIAARLAGELVHLKTAGTSYLEALRAVARVDPALFREVLAFAVAHYAHDRASYHVSADMEHVPDPAAIPNEALADTLDQFDARQALHVTFGTVLTATDDRRRPLFRDRLYAVLGAHEEAYYAALESHIARHLRPFSV